MKGRWPFYLVLLLFLLVFAVPKGGFTLANGSDQSGDEHDKLWQEVSRQADIAFQLVEEKKYTEARQVVLHLAEQLLQLPLGQYVQHVEQANILTEMVMAAKGALTQAQLDEKQVYRHVLRLRLTVNAINHPSSPAWLDFYPQLIKELRGVQSHLQNNQRDQFYHALNRLFSHYEFIRPAIVVSHPPQIFTQLDSLISHLDRHSAQLFQNKEQTAQLLDRLGHLLNIAFFKESPEQQSAFILLLVGMTLLISSILAYVAWKKYRGEERQDEMLGWGKAKDM